MLLAQGNVKVSKKTSFTTASKQQPQPLYPSSKKSFSHIMLKPDSSNNSLTQSNPTLLQLVAKLLPIIASKIELKRNDIISQLNDHISQIITQLLSQHLASINNFDLAAQHLTNPFNVDYTNASKSTTSQPSIAQYSSSFTSKPFDFNKGLLSSTKTTVREFSYIKKEHQQPPNHV